MSQNSVNLTNTNHTKFRHGNWEKWLGVQGVASAPCWGQGAIEEGAEMFMGRKYVHGRTIPMPEITNSKCPTHTSCQHAFTWITFPTALLEIMQMVNHQTTQFCLSLHIRFNISSLSMAQLHTLKKWISYLMHNCLVTPPLSLASTLHKKLILKWLRSIQGRRQFIKELGLVFSLVRLQQF